MTTTIRRRFAGAALALTLPGGAAAVAANSAFAAFTAVGGDPGGAPHSVPIPQTLRLLLKIDDPTDPPASTAPMAEVAVKS